MSAKKDIMWRVGVMYLVMVAAALTIVGKIVWLQFAERDKWSVNSDTAPIREVAIEANRGDIYSADDKLLAVSVPYYDIRMDMTVESLTDDIFYDHLDALCHKLAGLDPGRNWLDFKKKLINARHNGDQYYLVMRDISYDEMIRAKSFPIFKRGRYKGGVRFIEKSSRVKPNGYLASRTIGSVNLSRSGNIVGLEGAYDKELGGKQGLRLYKRLSGNIYVPLFDRNEVDPEDGMDVISTIDLNIQDVAEKALYKQLKKHNAEHGTAVLMEVETGDIKAIANLKRNKNGNYWEAVNYAVGESTVPGSTFKAVSLLIALEDNKISIFDTVDIGNGRTYYYGVKVEDSGDKYKGKITVQKAFEISSNVGITKLIYQHYKDREKDFINAIYKLGLNKPLGLEIKGEGAPFIKSPDHAEWSGVSLPMMSYGYELTMTPLQILAFYNGIANKGTMVKPRFVESINYRGELKKEIKPEILNNRIASENTIRDLHKMLCGVVENGTARNLSNKHIKIAGKTGTAQIPDPETGYKVKSRISYQASFVGYFPADNPKYSCIVVVNSPSNNIYYGNVVAGPVFLEIANKVYATQLEMHKPINAQENTKIAEAPYSKSGNFGELNDVLNDLGFLLQEKSKHSDWVSAHQSEEKVEVNSRTIIKNLVPNVVDMGLKDAVFLLENEGVRVRVNGRGTVRAQSVLPGTRITNNMTIELEMSLKES